MGTLKQIDIKNRTFYFYNDMIDIKKIDSYKDIGIYNIGYITIKKIDDYEDIYSVNPLYLTITHASGYIEKKLINKYLIFDSIDENKDKNINIFDSIDKNIMMLLMKLETKSKK